jgi:inorganic pyrophosphatase
MATDTLICVVEIPKGSRNKYEYDPAQIAHCFSVYKDLDPGRSSGVNGWGDRAAAPGTITERRDRYQARLIGDQAPFR